jgi:LysM repeat protein
LFRISRNLNVSLSDLAAWNNKDVNNPIIRVGETLVYYADPTTTAAAQTAPAATTPPPAPAVATAAPAAASSTNANANTTAAANTNGEIINYRVGRGDTFYSIARMFSTTVADLEALNNITASQLQAGQMIRVRNNTVTGVSN